MSDERYVIRAPKVDLNQLSRGRANMPEALKQMGFSSMRQGQADVISCIMAGRDTICVLPTACHAKGQGILMADGSIKKVEDIVVGDLVMGWDGTSRRVTHLKHGEALCSRVTPQDGGAPYVVTDQHLLTLVFESRGRDEFTLADPGWAITDMSVENYRTLTTASKAAWRGVRAMTHPACGSPVRYKAHGIHVMPVGIQEFFGFTITGDGRYLMDDFTVTHNTGKTACFVLPTLALEWRTLVFSPLISLMRDQVQSLAAKGVRVGSLTSHDPAMNDQYIKAWLRGEIQVLYVAPERLRREDFLHAMRQVPPDFVVMDEAHCFPGDFMVATEFGNRTLHDIHLSRMAGHTLPRAWTRNAVGFLELKPITMSWQHSSTGKKMLRVVVRGKGAVDCTDDHVWVTKDGEVTAGELVPGSLVHCKAFGGQELRGLNPDQLQLVIGSYLGDGGLGCTGSNTNSYRVAYTHGWEQREYCVWKTTMLGGEWEPLEKNGFSGKPAMKGRSAVFQLPGIIGKGGRWCKKAEIPEWMLSMVDARALAIWLMDDGSYSRGGITLHTQGFTDKGVDSLRAMLRSRFGIATGRLQAKGWIISIGVAATNIFRRLVRPYMRPEFMYKLGLLPEDCGSAHHWSGEFSTALYAVDRVTELQHAPEFLYDIEVEDNHNFFVFSKVTGAVRTVLSYDTNHAVLVHNCLSSWSDNFRSAYCVVGDFIRDMNPNVVATFTATCPPEVELDIRRVMCIQKAIKTTYYPRRNNLDLRSQPFPGEPGLATLLERVNGPSVIYCASVKRVEQLAKDLGNLTGKEVHFYHGQLPKAQRSHTQDMFARGEAQWMVATNAFGMGVDVPNIRLVVHFDVSDSIEGLAQEAGRGGRDGKHTLCMAYDNKDTVGVRNFLIRMSNPDPSEVEDIYEAMLKNCDTSGRVTVSVDELCKRAGLRVVSRIGAILQILGGSLVIDRKRDDEKRGMVKWLNRVDDPKLQRYMDAARLLGEPEQDGFISVDLIAWADHLGVGDASLKSFLRDKTAAHILDYIPPDRAAPIKVIGDKRLINFERIQERQDRALAKFAQVLRYAREIPDKDKHSYIEAMLGMDSNTLGATQPAQ